METIIQEAGDKELQRETSPPFDQQLEREQPLQQPKIEPPVEDFPQEKQPSFIQAPPPFVNELTGVKSQPHTKISESAPQTLLKKAILTTECSWKETVELSGNSADLTQWIEYVMKDE
ncbi:hypothetical protein niasHT_027202 [Heterodera trifolii]|uniref:Uncharacterized protein n=1 Tax=Heterodera trifolii TaxID=157864 RepID=A0ABD2KNH9_9BILA